MVTYCSSLIFLKWLLSFHLLVCGGVFHLTLSDILRYFIFCTIFKCCLMSRCFILRLVVFILEMVSGASLILFFLVILHKYQFDYISQFYLLNHFSHPLNSQSAVMYPLCASNQFLHRQQAVGIQYTVVGEGGETANIYYL